VQNLGNLCEILAILNSSIGNFYSPFVGTLDTCLVCIAVRVVLALVSHIVVSMLFKAKCFANFIVLSIDTSHAR